MSVGVNSAGAPLLFGKQLSLRQPAVAQLAEASAELKRVGAPSLFRKRRRAMAAEAAQYVGTDTEFDTKRGLAAY